MAAIIAFFTSKLTLYAVAIAAVCALVWYFGHTRYEQGIADQIAADKKAGAKIGQAETKVIHDIQIKYLPQQDRIVTVTKTITQEIPKYVTVHDDAACTISNGFVRLHDAAAASTVPPGVSGDDGAASGVTLSAATATIVENYGICHQVALQLKEWQDWYVRERAAYETGGR